MVFAYFFIHQVLQAMVLQWPRLRLHRGDTSGKGRLTTVPEKLSFRQEHLERENRDGKTFLEKAFDIFFFISVAEKYAPSGLVSSKKLSSRQKQGVSSLFCFHVSSFAPWGISTQNIGSKSLLNFTGVSGTEDDSPVLNIQGRHTHSAVLPANTNSPGAPEVTGSYA